MHIRTKLVLVNTKTLLGRCVFKLHICTLGLVLTNPLTTDDDYSRHQNSATRYQLAQSILKIGSALAERVGQGGVGGCHLEGDSAWCLLQLAVEKPWSVLGGLFFLHKQG